MNPIPQRQLTCGLIIASPAGWLLGHANQTEFWDLPKGQREPDEDPLDAALRECWEETGLDLSHLKARFAPVGHGPYNKKLGKTLALFHVDLPHPLDLSQCECRSWVRRPTSEHMVLDMDAFAWVPPHRLVDHVKPRMIKYLKRQGLLAP